MDNERDMKNVVSSFAHAWLFAVVAYCHLGIVIHRPAFYRQNYILPLLFMFFPFLYFCQVSMNLTLLIRQCQSTSPRCCRFFLVASALDVHGTRAPRDPDEQPSTTSFKLSIADPSDVFRYNKHKAGSFSRVLFISRILVLLLGVYQGVSASIIYCQRVALLDDGTLVLDHLTDIYAICGTTVMLATTGIMLQPYEWRSISAGVGEGERDLIPYMLCTPYYQDTEAPEENPSEEGALGLHEWRACEPASEHDDSNGPAMVTSTVWMFDAANAVVVHSVIFLVSLFCILSTVGHEDAPAQSLTWLYRLLLLLVPIVLIGSPILQNKRTKAKAPSTPAWDLENEEQSWKLVAAAITAEVVTALGIWVLAIVEATLATSSAGFERSKDWKTPNPGASQFHHVFWSIWT